VNWKNKKRKNSFAYNEGKLINFRCISFWTNDACNSSDIFMEKYDFFYLSPVFMKRKNNIFSSLLFKTYTKEKRKSVEQKHQFKLLVPSRGDGDAVNMASGG
jgi:hypothetical protein